MSESGYPIVLDVRDRQVVIVGGGAVGARKARGLIDAGATRVRVVSPTFHADMPREVERITGSYRPEHLSGAALVFAATDSPRVNDAVVRDAHGIRALVSRADTDDANPGDFATPAMIREAELLITVSSSGSPALSAMIRHRLAERLDWRWLAMAKAMRELRPVIRQTVESSRRAEVFRALCTDEALDELARCGPSGLTAWLSSKFPELRSA
jgi:precorrin-2 dehydrogenase / sirohydrochlorin ferrochelatase